MIMSDDKRTNGDLPHAVVVDPTLSTKKKIRILQTLEQDARLMDVATAEGMIGGKPSNLRQVLDAKHQLKGEAANNPLPGSDAELDEEMAIEKLDP
jgi:hypothetical protein